MVSPQLRALLAAAPGAGRLVGDDVRTGAAEHPVCGDRVEVDVRLVDGMIVAFAWRATACPATTAVAAAAATCLPGRPLATAASALREHVQRAGGLQVHERHAEALLLRALQVACPGAG